MPLTKSMAQGFGNGKLYPYLQQMESLYLTNQGNVWFVDNNGGSDSNDGLSWETAFKTLTYAMGISHADIANSKTGHGLGWAARNTLYCRGDTIDEDLTTLAQKTDIIGVGSCDEQPRCRIT